MPCLPNANSASFIGPPDLLAGSEKDSVHALPLSIYCLSDHQAKKRLASLSCRADNSGTLMRAIRSLSNYEYFTYTSFHCGFVHDSGSFGDLVPSLRSGARLVALDVLGGSASASAAGFVG